MTFGATFRFVAVALLFVSVPASASAGADAKTPSAEPPASLSVSPSRVRLVSGAHGTIRVTNSGARPVVVAAGPAGYSLDLRGRPQIVGEGRPRGVAAWLTLRPGRFVLAPGASAPVTVTAAASRHVPPGDHPALVLFEARSVGAASVAVALRLGIIVDVRGTGRVVRRVDIRSVRVRRAGGARTLEVVLANRGNVSELVTARRLRVLLRQGGHLVATLRGAPQTLLPRATGLVDLRCPGKLRGPVTAIVRLAATNGGSPRLHRFSLRL